MKLLIADDLTGACDSAVHFARRGVPTTVHLDLDSLPRDPVPGVVALTTGTRDLAPSAIVEHLNAIAARTLPLNPSLLFKKIDSTLRGNPGAEIAATMQAFRCDLAIITPAFPPMNRIVEDGHLRVTSDLQWKPVHVADTLQSQGLGNCCAAKPGAIRKALDTGAKHVALDACTLAELEAIVLEMLTEPQRILWAGSAGLANALAAALYTEQRSEYTNPRLEPLIFCLGSDHPITIVQENELLANRPSMRLIADEAEPQQIAEALSSGHHVVLRIARGITPIRRIRELLDGTPRSISALVLSGGDTAAAVLNALEARTIDLKDEVTVGLPWGTLHTGAFDDLPVVTKSGGFGSATSLIEVADYFQSASTI